MTPCDVDSKSPDIPSAGRRDAPVFQEILHGAIVKHDAGCWQEFYTRFAPLVLHWTGISARAPLDQEEVAAAAWERFVRSYSAAQLAQGGVDGAAAYLKRCTRAAAIDAWRAAGRERARCSVGGPVGSAPAHAPGPERRLAEWEDRHRLWAAVRPHVRSPAEALAMRLTYEGGLRPGEIHQRDPALFPSPAAVYRVLRLVHDRLRRCRELRAWYEAHRTS